MVDANSVSLCMCSVVSLWPFAISRRPGEALPSPPYIPPPSSFLLEFVAMNSQEELGSWELPTYSPLREKLTQDLPQSYSSLLNLGGGEDSYSKDQTSPFLG